MLAKSSEPAGTWMPPPWPTPWILFRIRLAPSSTVARKFFIAAKLRDAWSGLEDGWKISRVCPETPPSTWQLMHLAWTIGPEMRVRKKSRAESEADFTRKPRRPSGAIDKLGPPLARAGHMEAASTSGGVEAYMVFSMRRCACARRSS